MSNNIIASIQPAKTRKVQEEVTHPSNLTVNLPQLSLPIFNGDSRQWRQFWSSFNAAAHSQTNSEIQKLNFLYSCLKRNALQTLGEGVERSSIETLIESKLPLWIINKSSSTYADSKCTIKMAQKQRYNPRETSAFSTIQSNQISSQLMANKRRPYTFCARDHWDSDCDARNYFYFKEIITTTGLFESDKQIMEIAPFGMKKPKLCSTVSTQLNVRTLNNEVITLYANVVEYLTNGIKSSKPRLKELLEKTRYFERDGLLQIHQSSRHRRFIISTHVSTIKVNVNINFELEKFWKLETTAIQGSPNADDDDHVLTQFKLSLNKKEDTNMLPLETFQTKIERQFGRFKSLIKRLQLQSLLQTYNETIKELHQSGIIEEASTEDKVGVIYYLPHHHEVLIPGKTTTKLRNVCDASAHHKGFKSLNEVLYRGPVMLLD
ncbi:putative Reverse transcriptase [Dirofilaria immitis]|nr:putative Reverse transcriptase [Dirofilaria immitis]